MRVFMTQDLGLLEMDPLYRIFLVFLLVILFRVGVKSFRKRALGEKDYEGLIALLGITGAIGLFAIFRVALQFYERVNYFRFYGIGQQYYWSLIDELKFDTFVYGIVAALFGCIVTLIVFKAASIKDSAWTKRLIRFRHGIITAVLIGVISWSVFAFVYIPHRNRQSMLAVIETSVAIDAYRDPKEVIVYRVTPEMRMLVHPPIPDISNTESEALSPNDNLRNHVVDGSVVAKPSLVRECLDQIHIYKAKRYRGYVQSDYLIRYSNEKSVVDLWISDYFEEIEIFVSKDAANIESILAFSKPYEDAMVSTDEWGFRFSSSNRDWIVPLARLLH